MEEENIGETKIVVDTQNKEIEMVKMSNKDQMIPECNS